MCPCDMHPHLCSTHSLSSVRSVDDYGSGPPVPIRLGVAAADPAAVATAQRSWGERELARVAAGTGCNDKPRLEAALAQAGGDVDAAVEWLVELLGLEEDAGSSGANGDSGSRGDAVVAPASATAVALESISSEVLPQQQQQQQQQQQEQQATTSGSSCAAEGPEHVVVCLQPGSGTSDFVSLELTVIRGTRAAQACSGGIVAAEREEQQQSLLGTRNKGVRVRGRVKDAAAAAPNRNKPCPCGSGAKYKNCCAKRKRAALAATTTDAESRAAVADTAAKLTELFI